MEKSYRIGTMMIYAESDEEAMEILHQLIQHHGFPADSLITVSCNNGRRYTIDRNGDIEPLSDKYLIDYILARKNGGGYQKEELLQFLRTAESPEYADVLSAAKDEESFRMALCKYIDIHRYNPILKRYVLSEMWVEC